MKLVYALPHFIILLIGLTIGVNLWTENGWGFVPAFLVGITSCIGAFIVGDGIATVFMKVRARLIKCRL